MSLFSSTEFNRVMVMEMTDLLIAGACLADEMLSLREEVSYEKWAQTLCEQKKLINNGTTEWRLLWIWDTLRNDPDLRQRFGDLPPAVQNGLGQKSKVKVFNAGEWFVIGLKQDTVARLIEYSHRSPWDEDVAVQTLKDLYMQHGKGHRLECCDCESVVTIHVPEVYSQDREADIMRIEKDRIALENGSIKVRVDSLNHAYTVSSRRLEPKRRSHGGRTYDHVVHAGEKLRIRLEDIRQTVESGSWEVPATPPAEIPTSGSNA